MSPADFRFSWRRTVVRDGALTDAQRRVLLELESYANADGSNAHPGVLLMARVLRTEGGRVGHLSEKTVRTALLAGVERGYIVRTEQGRRGRERGSSDVYRLVIPEVDGALPVTAVTGSGDGTTGNPDYRQSAPTTGNSDATTGKSGADYRQSGLPNTRGPVDQRGGGYVPGVRHQGGVPDPAPSMNPSEDDGGAPAAQCARHLGQVWTPEPCGPCGDARRARQAWDARQTERAEEAKRAGRAALAACGLCDEAGWRLGPDGYPADTAARCNHQPHQHAGAA